MDRSIDVLLLSAHDSAEAAAVLGVSRATLYRLLAEPGRE